MKVSGRDRWFLLVPKASELFSKSYFLDGSYRSPFFYHRYAFYLAFAPSYNYRSRRSLLAKGLETLAANIRDTEGITKGLSAMAPTASSSCPGE